MTTQELIKYYADLLILQYVGKPKAHAMVETFVTPAVLPTTSTQQLLFSSVATSGSFVLNYNGNATASISWSDSFSTIQTKLRALTGLGGVIVTGSIASKLLVVQFVGVAPPALSLTVSSNTLQNSLSLSVTIGVNETDVTLPLAIQNAFNLVGDAIAEGVNLDVIGKYAGVSRNGYTFTGPITLNDSDFLVLIKVAIIKNSSGSSLYDIQALLNRYFGTTLLVFDYQNMHMDYFFDSSIGSKPLAELFVKESVLPKPMGVQLGSLIYAAGVNAFFGFRTYLLPGYNVTGFNTYSSYSMDSPWLSYSYAIAL